jgi:hypothetical protein
MPYVPPKDRPELEECVEALAEGIVNIAHGYGYDGAFAGELNFSVTRLIQRIPQIMVDKGYTKDEIRYWILAIIKGVLDDVKEEYRTRVSDAYEAFQIAKNGDCYDTPYITELRKLDPSKEEYIHVFRKRENIK